MTEIADLRPATPADAEDIAGIAVRTWHDAYAGIAHPQTLAERDLESQTARWQTRLKSSETETVVVQVRGSTIGYATTGPGGDPDSDAGSGTGTGGLLALYVDPPAQGAGHGTRLLADAVSRLRRAGYREATLWVFAEYDRARRLYERHGWTLDPSGRSHEDPTWREPAVRYRRRL